MSWLLEEGVMRRLLWLMVWAVVMSSCSNADPETTATSTSPPTTAVTTTPATAAPSGGEPRPTTAAPGPLVPQSGGSVVVGLSFVPTGLNELDDDGFAAVRWIRNLVRPAAYVLQPDGTRTAHLVTADPTAEDGGLFVAEDGSFEVTWTIDPRSRWSDGARVVTADFSLFHETECDRARRDFEGVFLDADPGQIRVRYPEPTPDFREAVSHVMPSHVIDTDVVCIDDGITWPSTGPFVIDSVGVATIELVRNPRYWRTDSETGLRLPLLDAMTLRTVEDAADLLSSRGIDVADGTDVLSTPDEEVPDRVALETGAGAIWEFLTFQFGEDNRNESTLNEHLTFRQALIHAIDREELAASVGWVSSNGLGGASPDESWSGYDHDPGEARALLEDLCVELERDCESEPPVVVFTTTANSTERVLIAGLIEEMWENIGVEVELQLEDSSLFFGASAPNGTYDVGMWAWVIEPQIESRLDVLGVFDPSAPGPEGRNWYHWGTAGSSVAGDDAVSGFTELMAGVSVFDPATVAAVVTQAEQLLADEVVVIPIGTRPAGIMRDRDVEGPTPTATSLGFLWNAEFWFRTDETPDPSGTS